MKKVKSFLFVFKKSFIPSIDYYKKIIFARFSFSLKYFVFLIFLINLITVISFFFKYNPIAIKNTLTSIADSFLNVPPDFQIKIIEGRLISSYPYPFFLWLDNPKRLFLVVDETAEVDKINIYKSPLLLTQSELVFNLKLFNKNLHNRILPLNYFKNQTINKQTFFQAASFINRFIKFFYLFYFLYLFLMLIIGFLIFFLSIAISLLTASFLVYLIFKFFTKKIVHYKKILQIGMHAITFPTTIYSLFFNLFPETKFSFFIKFPSVFIPFLFIFLIFLFNFIGAYLAFIENKKISHSFFHHHYSSKRK